MHTLLGALDGDGFLLGIGKMKIDRRAVGLTPRDTLAILLLALLETFCAGGTGRGGG